MTRHIKRGGKVWINIFPDKPVTEKPAETRMGSGKGNPEHWVAVVKPGRVMFELSGVRGAGGQGGHAPRHPQAAHQVPVRDPRGGGLMAKRRRAPRAGRRPSWTTAWPRPRRSCSTCASSTSPASSTTTARLGEVRRDIARIKHDPAGAREIARRRGQSRTSDERHERPPSTPSRRPADAQPPQGPRGHRGVHKMDKTVVVAVVDRVRHPRYDKTVQRTKQALRPRRDQRRPRGRPGARRRRPVRCRSSSAGASSKCSTSRDAKAT